MSLGTTVVVTAGLYLANYLLERQLAFAPPSSLVVAGFVLVTAGLFATYLGLLRRAWQLGAGPEVQTPAGRRERRLILLAPVAIWLGLACAPPVLSIDVFSYLVHGHQVNDGVNPYAVRTRDAADTPYGRPLAAWGWLPVHGATPYGPAWTRVEAWAAGRTSAVAGQMLALKLPVAVAGLLAAVLISRITTIVAPALALPAVVLFLWNPLVISELAGGGHNDGVMLFLSLAGIWLFMRERPGAGTAAICTAALVKLNALMVAPPLAALLLRGVMGTSDRPLAIRRVVSASVAAFATALIGIWLYEPFWIGPATFDGLRLHTQPNIGPSTGGVLFYYLTRHHGEVASARAVVALVDVALIGIVLAVSLWTTTRQRAVAGCAAISLALLVFSFGYWPWYVIMPVALCALAIEYEGAVVAAVAFSFAGRLAAPIDRLRLNGLMDWPAEAVLSTIIGVWLPALLVLAFVAVRHGSAARLTWRRAMVWRPLRS